MDEFWIFVDINTPPEIFSRLEKVLDDLRLANPKHFGDWVAVRAQPSPDNYKIRLAVYYQWAFNRVDLGPTGVARNLLVCKIMETLTAWGVALGANRFVSPPPPAPHMGRLPVPPAPQAPTSPVAEAPGDPLVAHLVAYQPRSEMRPDGTGLPPPGEPWADAPDHGNAVRDRPERAAAAMQIEALQGGGTLPEIPEDKAVVAPAEVAPIETGGGATEEERMMGRLALAHEEEACLKVD